MHFSRSPDSPESLWRLMDRRDAIRRAIDRGDSARAGELEDIKDRLQFGGR